MPYLIRLNFQIYIFEKITKSQAIMNTKDKKPEVSIDTLKNIVKKFKNQGLQSLTNFQLAFAIVTIGFKQVCSEFGTKWTIQNQKQALKRLNASEYDISWYGKVNSVRFNQLLPLTLRGDIQKVKNLIQTTSKESKPELKGTVDNFKRTALHLAVKQNFDVLAEYLITEGFSLKARDRQLKTPLHYIKSQLVCQVLMKKQQAQVFAKDNKLRTPAHYAATLDNSRVLEMLLKRKNVANQRDSQMKSPIFYAIYNSTAQQVNIIRVLIQNGANVNDKDYEGKTPLHHAALLGNTRCLPFLLKKGASIEIRDKNNKTPLDLAANNQKIKKLMLAYGQSKGLITEKEQSEKRQQYSHIQSENSKKDQKNFTQKDKQNINAKPPNTQIYTKQLNQVSTWIRQKFFVLMKKLQQSGVKANWHLKRPYIYTGSWAQDIDSLEDLYETFLYVNGPEAAMRTFNILCPFEKPLQKIVGKSQEAFQSFFGQNWFSNDPIQKVKNLHSQSKVRNELQLRTKEAQDLKTQLLGYRSQIQRLQVQVSQLQSQTRRYQKIEQDIRKERAKNTQQYSQILELMGQKQQLRSQIQSLISGQEKTKILSNLVEQLKQKNHSFELEIEAMKAREAASRRKCGQIFLKSLSQASAGENTFEMNENNLFDDDSILNLYGLLKDNPPNLEKRFKKFDKKGKGKLTVQQFTLMLEQLSMLPQDVMSMHRITGFAYGRKQLSFQQFKTILQNRHKNRPMWQKKLIKKMKDIILASNMTIDKFFALIDKDGNGTVQANQLRMGLQNFNIYMNQNDWCNLFNLLDSDKSGEIDLNQLKSLMNQQKTGKLDNISELANIKKLQTEQNNEEQKQQQNDNKSQNNDNNSQNNEINKQIQQQSDKNEDKQQQKQQSQKQQKQQYQDRQQIGNDILNEHQSQKFSQQYTQKDSELQQNQNMQIVNGQIKVQTPRILFEQQDLEMFKSQQIQQLYVRFKIDDQQYVKAVLITAQKQKIAVKFDLYQYKIQNREEFNLETSLWKTRQFDEENYLGQFKTNLAPLIDEPNKWAINGKYRLEALEFQIQQMPKRTIFLQATLIPSDQ